MDDSELLRLLIDLESDRVERKASLSDPDRICEAICAFANDLPNHRKAGVGTNAPVRIYWYSDRIETHSPGGPYGQVNRQNFGNPGVTDYRNPHLAEAMRNLGFIQRFGMGISIARQELEKNGNPPPEFIVNETSVLAIIRGRV